ncbi:MAG: tetratricopeptide repeat protein [Gammaproteobacteria bacterium]
MTSLRRNGLCLALVLLTQLAGAVALADDNVSSLPGSWADKLLSVPVPNLEGQAPDIRSGLDETRNAVNAALQKPEVSATELADAYGELGGIYQASFLRQSAEACFQNAQRLEPENFRWAYYAAWLADQTGQTELALKRYEHARSLKSDYPPLTLRMADVLADLNETDKAEAAYREVVGVPGLEAPALFGLGQIALLRRDYASAIDDFSKALQFDPAATRIHYPLGQALHAVKRDAEAKEHLAQHGDRLPAVKDPLVEELDAMKNSASRYFTRAMKAIQDRDYQAAAAAFAQGLESEPDNATARVSYARTLYLSDHKTEARQALERAVALQPDNTLGLFLLGVLSDEAGDASAAEDYYTQVLEHKPGHGGAHFFLANHYWREGDYPDAARHYAAAVADDPRNVPARLLYLDALDNTGAPAEQLKAALEAGVQHSPEQPLFTLRLIVLLATSQEKGTGDPQQALRLARELAEQQAIPPAREALALACAATGDFEQATEIQQQIVSLAVWSWPGEAERLSRTLTAYREGKMPAAADLPGAPPVQAPPTSGEGPFRDYPAARPY